jgi:hypothetical protein
MLTFTQNSTCPFEVGFVLLRERERERERKKREDLVDLDGCSHLLFLVFF